MSPNLDEMQFHTPLPLGCTERERIADLRLLLLVNRMFVGDCVGERVGTVGDCVGERVGGFAYATYVVAQ
tara:strand:- start:274 stop:483 length:210 start_codon:yes stop_codon:yes gene_type:complete